MSQSGQQVLLYVILGLLLEEYRYQNEYTSVIEYILV